MAIYVSQRRLQMPWLTYMGRFFGRFYSRHTDWFREDQPVCSYSHSQHFNISVHSPTLFDYGTFNDMQEMLPSQRTWFTWFGRRLNNILVFKGILSIWDILKTILRLFKASK